MKNLESNVLIAKFLDKNTSLIDRNDGYIKSLKVFSAKDLVFDSDWNWLMEVVNEIADKTGWELVMRYGNAYWNNEGEYIKAEESDDDYYEYEGGYENILNIFKAVVVFIKWYNRQNSK